MNIIITGGAAAGTSAAARLRRLDEKCQILLDGKGKIYFLRQLRIALAHYLSEVQPSRSFL